MESAFNLTTGLEGEELREDPADSASLILVSVIVIKA